jgi:hypothetical protein
MATLTDRIDQFVRWFFNSSPEQTSIESQPGARLSGLFVRRGALALAAVVALVLILAFHSVVVGAVERGAQRRAEAELMALQTTSRRPAPPPYVVPRKLSLARASD